MIKTCYLGGSISINRQPFYDILSLSFVSLGFHDIFFAINCDDYTQMSIAESRTKMVVYIAKTFFVVILRTHISTHGWYPGAETKHAG